MSDDSLSINTIFERKPVFSVEDCERIALLQSKHVRENQTVGATFPSDIWRVIFEFMGPSRTSRFLSNFAGDVEQFGIMNVTSSTNRLCHQWIYEFQSKVVRISADLLVPSQTIRAYCTNNLHPFEPAFFRIATLEEIYDLAKLVPKSPKQSSDVSDILHKVLAGFLNLKEKVAERVTKSGMNYENRSFGEKYGVNYYYLPAGFFVMIGLYLIIIGVSGSYTQNAIYIIAEICLGCSAFILCIYFFYIRWFSKRIEKRFYTLISVIHTQLSDSFRSATESRKESFHPSSSRLSEDQLFFALWNRLQQHVIFSTPLYVVLAAFCLTLLPLLPERDNFFKGFYRRSLIFAVPMSVFQVLNIIHSLVIMRQNLTANRQLQACNNHRGGYVFLVYLSSIGQLFVQTVCIICAILCDSIFKLSDALFVFTFLVPLLAAYFIVLAFFQIAPIVVYTWEFLFDRANFRIRVALMDALRTIVWDVLSFLYFLPVIIVCVACLLQHYRPHYGIFSTPIIWTVVAPFGITIVALAWTFFAMTYNFLNEHVFASCAERQWEWEFERQKDFVRDRSFEILSDSFYGQNIVSSTSNNTNNRIGKYFNEMVRQEFDKLITFDTDLYCES